MGGIEKQVDGIQNPTPFLNHLVIENILRYTNRVSDLKNLRLLCHQWKDLVTIKLLKTSIVNINSERKMQRYIEMFQSSGPIHINFHLKVLQSLQTIVAENFMKFILTSAEELHFTRAVMCPKEITEIFRFGNQLKTLSFNEVLFEDEDEKMMENNETTTQFAPISVITSPPFLTRLEVTTCEEGNTFPWTTVFTHLPNLEVLHAQLQSSNQVTDLLESMLDQQLKLKEFSSFLVDFETSQINLLACLEFPLKFLDLSISSKVSTVCLEELLQSSSLQNLETLKLFHETDSNVNKIVLPSLKNLKSLELIGDPVEVKIIRSICTGCPNLKHLNLSQIVNPLELIEEKLTAHQSLISLSIEEGFLSQETLIKFASLFPKLKKVCLFLNDENIGALFRNYECLEEIIVLGTQLSDLGIIGVSPTGRSCIGDCKKLRKFSVYPQPQNRITDMSIYHGLMHVKELTFVELPETAVTNEGLKALIRSKPHLIRLSAKIAINPRTGEHSLRSTIYQIL